MASDPNVNLGVNHFLIFGRLQQSGFLSLDDLSLRADPGRVAVQPVLGIIPTSVLFASMHVQYGPSLLLGYIFVLSLGLGYLRRRFNTTASFLAHAGYNFVSVMAAYLFA